MEARAGAEHGGEAGLVGRAAMHLQGPSSRTPNFSIGPISTWEIDLADRLIQSPAPDPREMKEQVLDSMDIERERGITIKAPTCRLNYKAKDGSDNCSI